MVSARRSPEDVSASQYEEGMTDSSTDVPLLQLEVLKKIQAELSALRTEVSSLRTDLDSGLGAVRSELHEGLAAVRSEIAEVRSELHDGLTRVRTEIAGVRGDMDVGFTAIRMMNDRRFLDHERRLRELESREPQQP
jgi:hypothetical protein